MKTVSSSEVMSITWRRRCVAQCSKRPSISHLSVYCCVWKL